MITIKSVSDTLPSLLPSQWVRDGTIAKENQLRLVRAINFLPAPRREESTYTCAKKAKYWREYGLSFVAGADDGIGGTIIIDRGAGSEARTRPDSCANEGVPHAMPRAS